MLTYFTFLYCYSVLSCLGLIKDLFLQNYSIVSCEPQKVVINYRSVFERNISVLTYGLAPFFIFYDIIYYISEEHNYFLGFVQALFCFYVGYILHRLIYINFKSRNYEFDKYNSGETLNFIFRMCNRDYFEIYSLYILPIYSPLIIIGANRFVYDVIFVITMSYAAMYYSNNECINRYIENFTTKFKLDSIDHTLNVYIRIVQEEYNKFMCKDIELSDKPITVANYEDNSNDESTEEFENVGNESNESNSNDDEFNDELKESLENKKDL